MTTEPEFPLLADRADPPYVADEKAMLTAWLAFHRATLLAKCADLTPEQLMTRSVPPSSLSLLGLLRHLTEVERSWFAATFAGLDVQPLYCRDGRPDDDFDDLGSAPVLDVLQAYRRACAHADEVIAAAGPDDLGARPRHGRAVSMRWILMHLVEEYARHNGHADLLRERIDGRTGD